MVLQGMAAQTASLPPFAGSDFIRPQRAREAEQRARDILDDAKFRQRNPDLGFGLVDTRRGFRGREMR